MNAAQTEAIRLVRDLGSYATPVHLRELGVRQSTIEACVRVGSLRWTRDGRLEAAS